MSWRKLSELTSSTASGVVTELVSLGHKVKSSRSSRVDTLYEQNGISLKQNVEVLREEYRALADDLADYLVQNLSYDDTMEWTYYGLYDGGYSGSGTNRTYSAYLAPVKCTCGHPSTTSSQPTLYPSQASNMSSYSFLEDAGYGPTAGTRVEVDGSRSNEADGFRVTVTTTTYGVPYTNLPRNPWCPWYPQRSSFSPKAYDVTREQTIDLVCYDNSKKILQNVKTVVSEIRDVPFDKVDALISANTSLTSKQVQYAVAIGSGSSVGYQYFNVRTGGPFASSTATTTTHATDSRATARLTDPDNNLFTVTTTTSEYWLTREAV